MTPQPFAPERYPEQLARWAAAYAAGRFRDLEGALDDRSTPQDVRRFLVNSFGNRYTWLLRETEFVGSVLGDHAALVRDYVRTVPQAPYDITGPSDEERFLTWLEETRPLNDLQRDFITCQRGELAVPREGRKNRPGHLHFQQLRKRSGERAARFGSDPGLRVRLNPIRFAARLLTPVLARGARPLPVEVLFFAAGTDVCTAFLEGMAAPAVAALAHWGPRTAYEWVGDCGDVPRGELLALARDLAARGLVAFE